MHYLIVEACSTASSTKRYILTQVPSVAARLGKKAAGNAGAPAAGASMLVCYL